MNKKRLIAFGVVFLIIALAGVLSAIPVCCEKTQAGAWCQYEDEAKCNPSFRDVPTSCESTSYCKIGTCINSEEGTCLPSAESPCTSNDGYWDARQKNEIPQCQYGCCILGEQVAFVTQTRCEKFSSLYNLETNFRSDIKIEIECLANAGPSAKGACVFEQNFQKKCSVITRKECKNIEANSAYSNVEFHEGYLCSAEELATVCGPRGGTKCGENGRVYFLDTCKNLANVYDSSKLNDANYWTYMQEPSCDNGKGNKDSAACGACDSVAGSICKPVTTKKVNYGEFICKDMDCKGYVNEGEEFKGGNYPLHSESWCADSKGTGTVEAVKDNDGNIIDTDGGDNPKTENLPGSKYFRKYCWEGEVMIEECAEFRGTICMESEIDGFRNAACRANLWSDCTFQNTSSDCEDRAIRDCRWMETGYHFSSEGLKKSEDDDATGVCVPLFPPGYDISSTSSDQSGGDWCGMARSVCIVNYAAKFGHLRDLKKITGEKVTMQDKYDFCTGETSNAEGENCECLTEEWQNKMMSMCTAIGDCGNKNNYIGRPGREVDIIDIEPVD